MSDNVTKWTANQEKFIEWLSLGKQDRIPSTHTAFANEIKVAEKTLYRWKKLPGFYEEVNQRVRENLKAHYAEVYDALISRAKRGDFQHLNKYLELVGDAKPPGSEDNPIHQKILIQYADNDGNNS